jgi:hypothetical protein
MLILLRFWMSLILKKQPIFKLLDSDKTEILLELEDDLRENILSRLSPKSRKN